MAAQEPLKLFLSYQHHDEPFVLQVNYFLKRYREIDSFCYAAQAGTVPWAKQTDEALSECKIFVFFLGSDAGQTQIRELSIARASYDQNKVPHIIVVKLSDVLPSAGIPIQIADLHAIRVQGEGRDCATGCARQIVQRLVNQQLLSGWVPDHGLPIGYPFYYEKKIIEEFVQGRGRLSSQRLEEGCPERWPEVHRYDAKQANPVGEDKCGGYRKDTAMILVDSRTGWREAESQKDADAVTQTLSLPEAGPRSKLYYPTRYNLVVGILVSGGIAPGINAVIESIFKRHQLYSDDGRRYETVIRGYNEGFLGFDRPGDNWIQVTEELVRRKAELGGTILRTSRADNLLRGGLAEQDAILAKIVGRLVDAGVQILYVIGGDGSMKAAHALWTKAQELKKKISVVGIPKTMDNDILWMWQSFGFLSAVEKARQAILDLHTEAASNPRLCIIQLFGSDSGFVVSHAALASGVCDAALIPEVHFKIKGANFLSSYIQQKLWDRYTKGNSHHGMIAVAETAIPMDVEDYIDDSEMELFKDEKDAVREFLRNGRRVQGQTTDELRSAGLKIVAKSLRRDIQATHPEDEYWGKLRVFTNEPRHLIRSVPPSVPDVVAAERLGILAVDTALAGYTDFMVSHWLTEYVLVPLQLVVLGRKRVPSNGIFWKSVLASTGQPARMCDCKECMKSGHI